MIMFGNYVLLTLDRKTKCNINIPTVHYSGEGVGMCSVNNKVMEVNSLGLTRVLYIHNVYKHWKLFIVSYF